MNIFNRKPRTSIPLAIKPESTFDTVLEMRLTELHRQIAGLKGRINIHFFIIMIAAILQFLFGITGFAPW